MRQVAGATPRGPSGGRVYVFDLNAVVSPDQRYSASRRSGQRALHRRGALHALGRHLRRAAAGPRAGGARPGPRRGVAGWRLAGRSATIDPDMVPEPALPVVRRATDGRRRRHGGAAGQDLLRRPGHRAHLPQPAAPRRRPARLLPHADARRLPPVRWLLHDRRLRRLGHLGSGGQAPPHGAHGDRSPCCPCCPTWRRTSPRRCAS